MTVAPEVVVSTRGILLIAGIASRADLTTLRPLLYRGDCGLLS